MPSNPILIDQLYFLLSHDILVADSAKQLTEKGFDHLAYLKNNIEANPFWTKLSCAYGKEFRVRAVEEAGRYLFSYFADLPAEEKSEIRLDLMRIRDLLRNVLIPCQSPKDLETARALFGNNPNRLIVAVVETHRDSYFIRNLNFERLELLARFAHDVLESLYFAIANTKSKPRVKQTNRLEELGLPTDTAELKKAVEEAVKNNEQGELFFWKDAKEVLFEEWLDSWFWSTAAFNRRLYKYINLLDPECVFVEEAQKPQKLSEKAEGGYNIKDNYYAAKHYGVNAYGAGGGVKNNKVFGNFVAAGPIPQPNLQYYTGVEQAAVKAKKAKKPPMPQVLQAIFDDIPQAIFINEDDAAA